jgi:hypothetical protein
MGTSRYELHSPGVTLWLPSMQRVMDCACDGDWCEDSDMTSHYRFTTFHADPSGLLGVPHEHAPIRSRQNPGIHCDP